VFEPGQAPRTVQSSYIYSPVCATQTFSCSRISVGCLSHNRGRVPRFKSTQVIPRATFKEQVEEVEPEVTPDYSPCR
jgi:hypothetical protein